MWVYAASSPDVTVDAVRAENCIFCAQRLQTLPTYESAPELGLRETCEARLCSSCGWWTMRKHVWDSWEQAGFTEALCGAAGSLAVLREGEPEGIAEVRHFLLKRYDERFTLTPKVFEETVASVYRSLGYHAIVTGHSRDQGIDVILERNGEQIGVQVKRWKNSVEVEQIRALAGALLLGGYTKGVFVTSSAFRAGAPGTAGRLRMRGIPIELIDADAFYSALKIAQQKDRSSVTTYSLLALAELRGLSFQMVEDKSANRGIEEDPFYCRGA